jgi:RND family efflux transporter MFP subunit
MAAPRPVDIASYKIQITQARTGYQNALDNLKEATITSPIDGVVAKVYQNPGDLSSLSQSTPLVTIVTNKQMATVALNEVDAAKAKVGQKASLTFNAIDGLEITGSVIEVDGVGTVTSGVVNYSVQIALDTQDARIKPEMSVSATIATDQKLDALLVPNTAIKTDTNGLSYVEILKGVTQVSDNSGITSGETPEMKYVQVGLSNDGSTEITEGLNEGDLIITKTISSTAAKTSTSGQQSGFGILGGGGGNVRVTR